MAKYQYWAANAAVESTVTASGPAGDRRGSVVWHTQGSGENFCKVVKTMPPEARRSS